MFGVFGVLVHHPSRRLKCRKDIHRPREPGIYVIDAPVSKLHCCPKYCGWFNSQCGKPAILDRERSCLNSFRVALRLQIATVFLDELLDVGLRGAANLKRNKIFQERLSLRPDGIRVTSEEHKRYDRDQCYRRRNFCSSSQNYPLTIDTVIVSKVPAEGNPRSPTPVAPQAILACSGPYCPVPVPTFPTSRLAGSFTGI